MVQRSLLYIIAIVLITGWALGFFLWKAGGFIHIMAVLAFVFIILGITRKDGIG